MWILIVALIIVAVVIVPIFLLFKYRRISQAEFELGFPGVTTKLKIKSEERQITKEKFTSVNLKEMHVDSDTGFIIHNPFSDEWKLFKSTLTQLWEDKGYSKNAMEPLGISDEICDVLIIRTDKAQTIKYMEQTLINGISVESFLEEVRQRFVEEVKEILYDQVVVMSFKKNPEENIKLLDFFFIHARYAMAVGPKKLLVNPANTVFLLDCSAKYECIERNGKIGDHIINNVVLCQENDKYFFSVILNYMQVDDKPTTVWESLREYLNSFRVLVD